LYGYEKRKKINYIFYYISRILCCHFRGRGITEDSVKLFSRKERSEDLRRTGGRSFLLTF
jgi:hypothetical protein